MKTFNQIIEKRSRNETRMRIEEEKKFTEKSTHERRESERAKN